MATYIRQEIAQYSEITMKMNFNKFSDRQIKNILKQIKNGNTNKKLVHNKSSK